MHDTGKLKEFIDNNYYSPYLLESGDFYQACTVLEAQAQPVLDWLLKNYDVVRMQGWNESQLETQFLHPFYKALGLIYTVQDGLSFQGKQHKLDAVIFENEAGLQHYEKQSIELGKETIYQFPPAIIAEHKQYSVPIDHKKIQDNPHHQLMRYLNTYRVYKGFLSNGRYWRFYDVRKPTANKIYYQIDLEALLELVQKENCREYFMYFYAVFSGPGQFEQKPYEGKEQVSRSVMEDLTIKNLEEVEKVRVNLRELIYSADHSIVELVGQRLHQKSPEEDLKNLFDQSVIFALRILFISYFEQNNWDLLIMHPHYQKYSLQNIAENLLLQKGKHPKDYADLQDLFDHLAKGNTRRKIPLFNGGLFDPGKAPLLEEDELLSVDDLRHILVQLYPVLGEQDRTLPITLQQLSVQDIGGIYENLLDYRFRIENHEVILARYKEQGKEIEAYLDTGDWAALEARANKELQKPPAKRSVHIIKHKKIPPGQLFLVDGSMQRKQSASYYTPVELSRPLVEAAVEAALRPGKTPVDILNIKILDNACGSGHFLVEVLDTLTRQLLSHIEDYAKLKDELGREKASVQEQVGNYISNYEVDELLVLKRLLMKKIIYGVDSDPLAVELSRLSLWLDTFIFGTPLSFIEHHIKCGNALMGSNSQSVRAILEGKNGHTVELFKGIVNRQIDLLENNYRELDSINDIRSEEIERSKEIYEKVQAQTQGLCHILDLVTCYQWHQGLVRDGSDTGFLPQPRKIKEDYQGSPFLAGFEAVRLGLEDWLQKPNEYQTSLTELSRFAEQYRFFHYELEFPEAFARNLQETGQEGFTVIIGNPPWDKVMFTEEEFFSQFLSNFRRLSKGQKNAKVETFLLDLSRKTEFESSKAQFQNHAAYYKECYPANSDKHTNLFRLFMEKNLSMLAPKASLCYVTPSSWTYEEGSVALRQKILQHYQIRFLYQFENRNGIFPLIHRSYKFAITQIVKEAAAESIPCRFMLQSSEDLKEDARPLIHYPIELIQKLDSEQWSLLEVRHQKALDIAEKLYAGGQALQPEYLDFYQELNMTTDSDLFVENIPTGDRAGEADGKPYLPLYQGQHIHQFNQGFQRPFTYHVEPEALKERLKSKEISRIAKAVGGAKGLKQLGLKRDDLQKFHRFNYLKPRLAFRDVASNTNERTVIMCLLPPNVSAGHSLWLSFPYRYTKGQTKGKVLRREEPLEKLLWLLALGNSLVLDFIARLYIDIHVSKTYFARLPFIQPPVDELQTKETYRQITGLGARLVLAYDEDSTMRASIPPLPEMAKLYSGEAAHLSIEPPKTQEARQKHQNTLRVELDIAVAKLYGLDAADMQYILSGFGGMQNKQTEFC
ncbi:MAG: hypothetical protein AAF975_02885, partial [Spirochaetota bacterium]